MRLPRLLASLVLVPVLLVSACGGGEPEPGAEEGPKEAVEVAAAMLGVDREVLVAIAKQDPPAGQVGFGNRTGVGQRLAGCRQVGPGDCILRVFPALEREELWKLFIEQATAAGWTLAGEACTTAPAAPTPDNPPASTCEASNEAEGKVTLAWVFDRPAASVVILNTAFKELGITASPTPEAEGEGAGEGESGGEGAGDAASGEASSEGEAGGHSGG